MKSKVSQSRFVSLSGLVEGKVNPLDILVARKNIVRGKDEKNIRRIIAKQDLLGFVSHPTLIRSKTAPYVDAWCHPYKNPEKHIDTSKPHMLMSESDFVDPLFITVDKRAKNYKWDYFYFFTGGQKNGRRKGFSVFVNLLPHLHKSKMKGIIINYGREGIYFENSGLKEIWNINRDDFKFVNRKMSPKDVSILMSSCRFGLFPNVHDCSPLLLSEALIRNVPVLVNSDILGGWKYVNEQTGSFFSTENECKAIQEVVDGKFSSSDWFMSNFGFKKSSERLAEFGKEHFESFKNCTKACFSGLSRFLA